jgi:hypothetical protein
MYLLILHIVQIGTLSRPMSEYEGHVAGCTVVHLHVSSAEVQKSWSLTNNVDRPAFFFTDYVHKRRYAWLDMRTTTGEPENELSSVWIESPISTQLKSVCSWHVKVTCRWRSLQFIIFIPQEGTDDNGVLNVNWYTWPVALIASSAGHLCVCGYTVWRTENVITLDYLTLQKWHL